MEVIQRIKMTKEEIISMLSKELNSEMGRMESLV